MPFSGSETTRTGPFGLPRQPYPAFAAAITIAVTGTGGDGLTESEVVAGGDTIILTITSDTWIAAGTGPIGSTANTQALLDGLVAAASPTLGWNNTVSLSPSDITRDSDTQATLTLPATATYSINADETLTWTIPAAVLTSSSDPVVASPTITVTNETPADTTVAPTGGWGFFNDYESELQRRRAREKRQAELLAEIEQIQGTVDQEIAFLIADGEREQAERHERERIRFLAQRVDRRQVESAFGERVARAYSRVADKGTYSALEALVREAKRAQDEEEFLLIALMTLDD